MKKHQNNIIFLFCLFFLTGNVFAADQDRDLPKIRRVELKAITTLVADILPGRGIKLIFPWVLDKKSTELPFSEQLTNTDIFDVNVESGQNHIVYTVTAKDYNIEGELSDAFINVAGFHLHFISDDKTKAGHILDFTTVGGNLQLDACNRFYMMLSDQNEFAALNLTQDRSAELEKVEQ